MKKQDLRKEWYSSTNILREILPFVWKRELAFINIENRRAVRFLSIKQPYYFLKIQEQLVKFHEEVKWNMYRSVCYYTEIPNFTYRPSIRSSSSKRWIKQEEFIKGKYFEGYDLFFDFDVSDTEHFPYLKNELLGFLEYLNEWVVPYQIYFSGRRGFQLVIPYAYLPYKNLSFNLLDRNNFFNSAKKIVENIKETFELHFLDLRLNGITTKLMKIPYSLSQLNCVVLPLSDEQIKRFKSPQDFHVSEIIDIKIKGRGSLERFSDMDFKEKCMNTSNFLKQFGGVK